MTTIARRHTWSVAFAHLPPTVNHLYGVRSDGKRFIRKEAEADILVFKLWCNTMGFHPDLKKSYALRLTFTVPTWRTDEDGYVKVAQDCIFGARADHRVVLLSVRKRVVPGKEHTAIRVREL